MLVTKELSFFEKLKFSVLDHFVRSFKSYQNNKHLVASWAAGNRDLREFVTNDLKSLDTCWFHRLLKSDSDWRSRLCDTALTLHLSSVWLYARRTRPVSCNKHPCAPGRNTFWYINMHILSLIMIFIYKITDEHDMKVQTAASRNGSHVFQCVAALRFRCVVIRKAPGWQHSVLHHSSHLQVEELRRGKMMQVRETWMKLMDLGSSQHLDRH